MGDLINLEALDIKGSDDFGYTGPIPAWWSRLTRQERMSLKFNQFSGCIPDELQYVPVNDLDRLDLEFCGGLAR